MRNDILWVIAARAGSKGIPNKNIKNLGAYPLLAYRIKSALSVSLKEDVILSTDSQEYKLIGEKYGAHVPFLRPDYLADDTSSSMDVILHAMTFMKETSKKEYKYVGLLEPTSPFVSYDILEGAISELEKDNDSECIVAVEESRPNTFFIQDNDKYLETLADRFGSELGRQSFLKQITPSGGFYISKWDNFIKNKTFYTKKTLAYLVDELSALEIDEPIDWDWAEFLLQNKININKLWK